MTKEIKKTQKSVQADTAKKDAPVEKKEPATVSAPEVVAEDVGVVEAVNDSTVVDLRSDEDQLINPVSSFGYSPKRRALDGRRTHVSELTDKPVLSIGGENIELTKIEKGSVEVYTRNRGYPRHAYPTDNLLAQNTERNYLSIPYDNQILTTDEVEWYTGKVAGIEFILSQGSQVIVTELISSGCGWLDVDEPEERPLKLTLLGSSIECKFLNIVGKCSLNNTFIRTDNLHLTTTTAAACHLSSKNAINLSNVDARSTTLNECDYLNVHQAHLQSISLTGFRNISLRDIKDSYAPFSLSVYSRPAPDLTINGTLTKHGAYHSLSIGTLPNAEYPHLNPELRIKRRIDYGTFSSQESVPFVRLNEVDIMAGDEVFLAKDFFPEYYGTSQKPAGYVFTGTDNGFNAPFANTGPAWLKTERGGELWEKAARIVFPGTKVIGKSGHEMIKTLLDQIRSRIGLYVELHNLKE